jgi:hypothetical protein
MLGTVPAGVELSDVITPLAVKSSIVDLVLDGDILQLSGVGQVRKQTYHTICPHSFPT